MTIVESKEAISMEPINERQSQEICSHILKYSPQKTWRRDLLRLTRFIWQPFFSHIFYELYNQGVIDSSRLHIVSALIDPTQDSCKM